MHMPVPKCLSIWILLAFILITDSFAGELSKGDRIPDFKLQTFAGHTISQQDLAKQEMSILYFFAIACKSCETGLKQLQSMVSEAKDDRLMVLALAADSSSQLENYAATHGITFPLISANRENLQQFNALYVHPTTYIVSGSRKILQVMQGGGASTEALLRALAQKQLQRGKSQQAIHLYQRALESGADQSEARAGIGYSLLQEGKLAAAESTFQELALSKNQQTVIQGQEGLAEVFLQQGNVERARSQVEAVLQSAPDRGPAHLTHGKILYLQGDKKAAEHEITLAAKSDSKHEFVWQKAEANYALGNLKRENNDLKIALASYKQAVDDNPYHTAALSNQGVTLQELGDPEKALESFGQLKKLSPQDHLVDALLRQAREAIQAKQDRDRQKRIDSLVQDLAKQFRSYKARASKSPNDDWTSPAIAVSILGFQTFGTPGLLERAGLPVVLQDELLHQLQESNVKVVDRELMESLLAELKLGTSDLADPDTALKLGRILAARLLASGSLMKFGGENRVSLRLIDTETTDIILPLNESHRQELNPSEVSGNFANAISRTIRENYPLKGRIALVDGNEVIINLGKKHGVEEGMHFNVLGDSEPVELNGRILGYRESKLGNVEVYRVEDLMAFSKIQEKNGIWAKNQKVILKSGD